MNNPLSQSVDYIKSTLIEQNIASAEQLNDLSAEELKHMLDTIISLQPENIKKNKRRGAGFTTVPLYKKKNTKNKKNIIKNSKKKNRK